MLACIPASAWKLIRPVYPGFRVSPPHLHPSTRQWDSHHSRHLHHQQGHHRAHISAKLNAGLTSDDRVDRSPSVAFHASQMLINKHDSKCPMIPFAQWVYWGHQCKIKHYPLKPYALKPVPPVQFYITYTVCMAIRDIKSTTRILVWILVCEHKNKLLLLHQS